MKNLKIRNQYKALILAGIMVAGTGAGLSACSKQEATDNRYSIEKEYDSFDELVATLPETKRANLQRIYNELIKLNGTVAESVRVESDGDKLFQIDWDTMQALVLAANDYSSKEMVEMFDVYEYNPEYLYELYQNFCTLFIPFGERLRMNTGLDTLIDNEAEREFFLKYENTLIEINNCRAQGNDKALDHMYKTAFDMIRADFITNNSGSAFANEVNKNDVTGYNALVIPYINTILELGRNSKYKLSDAELKQLNRKGICNTAYQSIKDNLEGYRNKADNMDEFKYEGAYEKAMNLAINYLQKMRLYFVSYAKSTLDILFGKLKYNDMKITTKYVYHPGWKRTSKKTVTRKYNSLDDLKKNESSEVIKQAEEGKKKVDEEISKENESKKDEAQSKADEEASKKSEENKKKSDEEMSEIKDNAGVYDGEGNKNEDAPIEQPDNQDEAISRVETTRHHDGPVYDSNGNIIVNGAVKLFSLSNITKFLGNSFAKVKSLRK